MDTAKASIESPTAMMNNSKRLMEISIRCTGGLVKTVHKIHNALDIQQTGTGLYRTTYLAPEACLKE